MLWYTTALERDKTACLEDKKKECLSHLAGLRRHWEEWWKIYFPITCLQAHHVNIYSYNIRHHQIHREHQNLLYALLPYIAHGDLINMLFVLSCSNSEFKDHSVNTISNIYICILISMHSTRSKTRSKSLEHKASKHPIILHYWRRFLSCPVLQLSSPKEIHSGFY